MSLDLDSLREEELLKSDEEMLADMRLAASHLEPETLSDKEVIIWTLNNGRKRRKTGQWNDTDEALFNRALEVLSNVIEKENSND